MRWPQGQAARLDREEEGVRAVVQEMTNGKRCGVTTDLWTNLNNEWFVSPTVHYITAEWEMTSLVLERSPFEERHTGENTAKGMEAILERHGLSDDDIEGAVTDDANDVIAKLRDYTNITRFTCMANTFDLCAKHL